MRLRTAGARRIGQADRKLATTLTALVCVTAGSAGAQSLEHDLPQPPKGIVTPVVPGERVVFSGPDLQGVNERWLGRPLLAIDVPDSDLGAVGQAFIGRTVTPQLVETIEGALNRRLAETHRPLVARWTPAPEAGPAPKGAVLAFRLDAVVTGEVHARGGKPGEADRVIATLGLTPGAPLDVRRLNFALDGMNAYPFRHIDVTLASANAGDAQGVDINITTQKPWQIYTGYKYASSAFRTKRRQFVGATVGNLLGRDSVLSFQATASPDAIPRDVRYPHYIEGALTYSLPMGPGTIEAGIDVGGILFHFPPNDYWVVDSDGTLDYRLRLFDPSGLTSRDMRFGVEARHERVKTITGDALVGETAEEMYEVFAGYHRLADNGVSHSDLDVSLHLSPGGINGGNADRHFADYSDHRMRSARYAFMDLSYDRAHTVGTHLAWHGQINAQLTTGPMPYYVQGYIGGSDSVRGYFIPDGTGDDILITRSELGWRSKGGGVAPHLFAFIDAGMGHDAQLKTLKTLASVGIGGNFKVLKGMDVNVDMAHTLRHGPLTRAGTNTLEANFTYRY